MRSTTRKRSTSKLLWCWLCFLLPKMYEGLTGFYKGFIPNLLRVTPACCITFLVYETMIAAFARQKMLGTSIELEEEKKTRG